MAKNSLYAEHFAESGAIGVYAGDEFQEVKPQSAHACKAEVQSFEASLPAVLSKN